jgi:drug/metabolite transporter (DMT)-like permease
MFPKSQALVWTDLDPDCINRIWAEVPDPVLGPKGVRLLLVFRGFSGYVSRTVSSYRRVANLDGSFFGLFGVYYSLQYLSLSDATVLTFLVPICTAVSGALFLGETFSVKQALAAGTSFVTLLSIWAKYEVEYGKN